MIWKFLVATLGLYIVLKCLLGSGSAYGPYRRSCLKRPAKESQPGAKPRFLDSVNACIKTAKKAILVRTGKSKKVMILATPTKSRVVCRWIDKKKHCFQKVEKRVATRRSPRLMGK